MLAWYILRPKKSSLITEMNSLILLGKAMWTGKDQKPLEADGIFMTKTVKDGYRTMVHLDFG